MSASRMTIPEHAHPLVRALFRLMIREDCTTTALSEKTGISRETLRNWRYHSNPRLTDLSACFQVLGKKIVVVNEDEFHGVG